MEEANSTIDNNKHFAVLIISEEGLNLSKINKQRENQCKYRDNLNEFNATDRKCTFSGSNTDRIFFNRRATLF